METSNDPVGWGDEELEGKNGEGLNEPGAEAPSAKCEICGVRRLAGFNDLALRKMHADEGHGVPESIRPHVVALRQSARVASWVEGGNIERATDAIAAEVSRLTAERDAMEEAIEDEAPPAEGIYQSVRDRLRLSNLRLADRDATIALQSAELSALRGALTEIAIAPCMNALLGEDTEGCGCPGCRARAALGGGSPTEETR